MGQENKENLNVQISDKTKRQKLLSIIHNYLEMSISLMEYYKCVAPTRKAKYTCTKSIRSLQQAKIDICRYKHIELLEYIYASLIGNNVIMYSLSGTLVSSKKIKEWDTEQGFVDFQKEMEEQRKKHEEEQKQRALDQQAIQKAKEQGKKVEMVYDKETKKVRPLIVEEKEMA